MTPQEPSLLMPIALIALACGMFLKWLWVIDVPAGTVVLVKRFGRYYTTITTEGFHALFWPLFTVHKVAWTQLDPNGDAIVSNPKFIPTTNRAGVMIQSVTKDSIQVRASLCLVYRILDMRVAVFDVAECPREISELLVEHARNAIMTFEAVDLSLRRNELTGKVLDLMKKSVKNTSLECVSFEQIHVRDITCPQGFFETLSQIQLAKKEDASAAARDDAKQALRLKATPNQMAEIEERHKVDLLRQQKKIELEKLRCAAMIEMIIKQHDILSQAGVPIDIIKEALQQETNRILAVAE
jgi:regulator of protease activity HflC (stomatin/prohibitin superfamily)